MRASAYNALEIISSIPGRIRFKLIYVLQYDYAEERIIGLFRGLKGIKNISFNRKTGNILILYHENQLDEGNIIDYVVNNEVNRKESFNGTCREKSAVAVLLPSINPLNYINKRFSVKGYEKENSFSKALLRIGLITGISALTFTAFPVNVVAAAVLSYPAIFFTIANTGRYLLGKIAGNHGLCVNQHEALGALAKTEELLLEDTLLLESDKEASIKEYIDITELQRAVALKELKNPISQRGRELIKSFRRQGIINIALISGKSSKLAEYVKSYLGISKGYYLDKPSSMPETSKYGISTIISYKSSFEAFNGRTPEVKIRILPEGVGEKTGDIILPDTNIMKLPKLLSFSKDTEEFIKRRQITAMTINVLALFLTLVRKINPLTALGIYVLNTIVQLKILHTNIDAAKGVLFQ